MKQVHELTPSDLKKHPLWYFPMSGASNEDEATIYPVRDEDSLPVHRQLLVRSTFVTSDGSTFPGYLYWSPSDDLRVLQPTMWVGDLAITFWNGIRRPKPDSIRATRDHLAKRAWPIAVTSDGIRGLASRHEQLDGIYFMESREIKCIRPWDGVN
jgi:hypothetical protein